MKRARILPVFLLILMLLAMACTEEKTVTDSESATTVLAEKIDAIGAARISEIRLFVGDSLYEYIDGGAELYHEYKFIEVATADYKINEIELIADIYRFDGADNAYGLFSAMRPDDPKTLGLGTESFGTSTTLDLVKGDYLVRVVVFEESEAASEGMLNLARHIESQVIGEKGIPAMFAKFPAGDRVAHTEKIQAISFLGHGFLNDVYTCDYELNGNRVVMFLAVDESGEMFTQFAASVGEAGVTAPGLPFDDNQIVMMDDSYYGKVLAGRKGTWLAGVIDFKDDQADAIAAWVGTLK